MMRLLAVLFALVATAFANGLTTPFYNASIISARSSNGYGYQYVDCYDQINQEGNSIRIWSAIPDLRTLNFDNRIVSVTYNGIYLFYEDRNFNSDTLKSGVYAEAWGEDVRVNFGDFAGKASSVRSAGAPEGYKYDTLNFYEGEIYQGEEQYFNEDTPLLKKDNFGRSLIVTGCNPWTLYEFGHYDGHAVCVYPGTNCSPAFFKDDRLWIGMSERVSSVRKGCFSEIKAYGEKYLKRLANIGPLGKEGQFFTKQQ